MDQPGPCPRLDGFVPGRRSRLRHGGRTRWRAILVLDPAAGPAAGPRGRVLPVRSAGTAWIHVGSERKRRRDEPRGDPAGGRGERDGVDADAPHGPAVGGFRGAHGRGLDAHQRGDRRGDRASLGVTAYRGSKWTAPRNSELGTQHLNVRGRLPGPTRHSFGRLGQALSPCNSLGEGRTVTSTCWPPRVSSNGRVLFVMASALTTHLRTSVRPGISYITSMSVSSSTVRSPRTPVLCLMAVSAMALSASSVKTSSTPSIPK